MKGYTAAVLVICACLTSTADCTCLQASCLAFESMDLSQTDTFANADDPLFQFPLDEIEEPFFTNFAVGDSSDPRYADEYHAAEDYLAPAGTSVYAFAQGAISYSGPMDGYGWLIIINHPEANLYSLYGHLSPSRWRQQSGTVKKGELIAYLGDPDENGGTATSPLTPHLHFGIRIGQRNDYSSIGDWRWQAGWVKSNPQNMGWQQPSKVITEQGVPNDAFIKSADWFLKVWGPEILVTSIFLFLAPFSYLFVRTRAKKHEPIFLMLYGIFYALIAWISFTKGMIFSYGFVAICLVLLAAGFYRLGAHKLVHRLPSDAAAT